MSSTDIVPVGDEKSTEETLPRVSPELLESLHQRGLHWVNGQWQSPNPRDIKSDLDRNLDTKRLIREVLKP